MKHLLLMRRAIVRKQSACLVFATPRGLSAIYLGPGVMTTESLPRLDNFWFTETAHLAPVGLDSSQPTVPVQKAVIHSVNRLACTEAQMHEIEVFAASLPPLHVRLAPLHRFGMKDFPAYVQLHARFMQHGPVMMSGWLTERNEIARMQRYRVFLVTFVLGLLAAPSPPQSATKHAAQQPAQAPPDASRATSPRRSALIQRIIQRIRGMA